MNIVFVDHEGQIRSFLRDWVAEKGHSLRCLGEIDDLLEFLADNKPDLICLDLLMPQPEEASVLNAIRELSPTTSIALMTKPFSPRIIEKVLRAQPY